MALDVTPPPLLGLDAISKSFGSVKVLDSVSFELRQGELHALMGENGAGKSTLVRVIGGIYRPDAGGRMTINGVDLMLANPRQAAEAGIAIIHQELNLAENMTVAENIFLGHEPRHSIFADRAAMRTRTHKALDELGADFGPDVRVSSLELAQRQIVEIARAVQSSARIVVMDEPTTALSNREADRLFAIIARMRARGVGIIYISHRMDEVYSLSDRVTVLRDGRLVGTLAKGEINAERLTRMMVGRDLSTLYRKKRRSINGETKPLLEVTGIERRGVVEPASFSLQRGEVLGIAGLAGSGRTELARLICGIDARSGGHVRVDGKDIPANDLAAAGRAGLAYLTEDRRALGLFMNMHVRDNLTISISGFDACGGVWRNGRKARVRTDVAIRDFSIRTSGQYQKIGRLSGGNQQKVLLARLLQGAPKVLVLDEPTRGVDMGAKSQIYTIIDDLAQRGVGIIVISSELTELIGIADRVLVMREGALAGEIGNTQSDESLTEEGIIALAMGTGQTGREATNNVH
ncbi:sugar ABC transporter ATP-binding protein [Phyllobacterium chamaecytisi]|uniref:sugar ABC transporter ATP-binding protein n=1 Tax=Phyllobacterium chamaecytisi TaxID=2876082 RepID=UPI001CCCFCD2|nr:sugar ABC transporter ATP-binding protein [Phyllobacterium sp. KW56]MBZ9606018.1 sugar ABC transporter ATP-binding protein [Phyllobacterium sp. KW56]